MTWLATFFRQLGPKVDLALGAIVALKLRDRSKISEGRKEAENDAAQDTIERVEKGREAVRDGRDVGDPADRLRKNDGLW